MSEVTGIATHLPDSLVGFVPVFLHEASERPLQVPRRLVRFQPSLARLVQSVHHLPVHVQLELMRGGVPNAHRIPVVARKPFGDVLVEPTLTRDAVHDLQLGGITRDSAQKPCRQSRASSLYPEYISDCNVIVASRNQQNR